MLRSLVLSTAVSLGFAEAVMAQERIRISSDWGEVTAELAANETATSFARMLPLTLDLNDHLRQEKVGTLPAALPETARQRDFSAGTLGIWRNDRFVIYYRSDRVPQPGIMILGHVTGNVSIFDRPGPITVSIRRAD